MGDNKNNEQEDASENADSSTQPNESYNLSLALSSYQIEQELSNCLILGLSQQKRFKDVSYLSIKDNSITLKAYDSMSNQQVIIKVRKEEDTLSSKEGLQKMKNISNINSSLFVQIIDFWILQKEEYSVVFIEMEYLPQSLESYLNNRLEQEGQISEDEQLLFAEQIFLGVKQMENQQLHYKQIHIKNYFIKERLPKFSLCRYSASKTKYDSQVNYNSNENDSIKNCAFQICIDEQGQDNYLLCAAILILIISNWDSFNDQIINSIGVFQFSKQIMKGDIDESIQIDATSMFYKVFQSILNDISNNKDKQIQGNLSAQMYIDILLQSNQLKTPIKHFNAKDDQSHKERVDSQGKQDDHDDDQDNNCDNETGLFNKNSNSKLVILNPSLIMNKYINSIQTFTQNQNNNILNDQISKHADNENSSLNQNTQINYSLKHSQQQKQQNYQQNNEIKDKIQSHNLETLTILKQDAQQGPKEQSEIQINTIELQQQQNLQQQQQQQQQQLKQQYQQQQFQQQQQQQQKDMKNEKEIEQEVVRIEEVDYTPAHSKSFVKDKGSLKIIQFSTQKDEEDRVDISYNNDIVIEIKDSNLSVANSQHKKNLENSNTMQKQNPYEDYKRYLYDLDVECDNIQEIFIQQLLEPTSCLFSFSCVNSVSFVRLKLFSKYNPFFGKAIMEAIFIPFIIIFNKPWLLKKGNNILVRIVTHILFWIVKILNIFCMLVLMSVYLSILFTVLLIVHAIYFTILILTALILIPTGLVRIYFRMYLKLSDWKSSLIFSRQSSYTWFDYDSNYQTAKDFNAFHHKIMYKKYQYEISPNKQFQQSYQ